MREGIDNRTLLNMVRIKLEYVLFYLALILYGATSSIYPFPRGSVQLIVSHSGVSPFLLNEHPLWTFLAHFLRLLPFPLALALNALSVLCGAFAVALCYKILVNCKLDSDY